MKCDVGVSRWVGVRSVRVCGLFGCVVRIRWLNQPSIENIFLLFDLQSFKLSCTLNSLFHVEVFTDKSGSILQVERTRVPRSRPTTAGNDFFGPGSLRAPHRARHDSVHRAHPREGGAAWGT